MFTPQQTQQLIEKHMDGDKLSNEELQHLYTVFDNADKANQALGNFGKAQSLWALQNKNVIESYLNARGVKL